MDIQEPPSVQISPENDAAVRISPESAAEGRTERIRNPVARNGHL